MINLDGGPHDPDPRPFHQPVLVLAHPTTPGENDSYIPKLTAVLEFSSATTYLLTVPASAHLTFTDAPLYLPPLPSLAGDLGRTEGPTLTAALSAAFLDTTLRGTSNDIAATLAKHGTLTTHVGARTP